MTAARYWRLEQITLPAGGAGVTLSELELWDGGTRVDGGATLTCTLTPGAGVLEDLKDSTSSTVSFGVTAVTAACLIFEWDFGSSQQITKVGVRGPTAAAFLRSFTLSYSADAVEWTPYMWTHPTAAWPGASTSFYLDTALGDQHYGNVALFLRGSDISGVQRVSDVSLSAGESITLAGSTRAALLGDGSAVIDFGTSDSHFNTLSRAGPFTDIELPGDFTLDFWLYPRGYSSQWGSFILDARTSGTHNGMVIAFGYGPNGNKIEFVPARGDGTHISIKSDSAPALNVETHVEFYRSGNTVGMLINGVAQAETGTLTGTVTYQQFRMGSSFNNAGSTGINGYIRDFRITAGVARHTAGFTPSIAVAGYAGHSGAMNQVTPVRPQAYRRAARRDIESFGAATISGTVKELTTPVANRQVLLLEQDGLRCRRETRSAADGSYSFANVRESTQWVVLAFDPNGAYNAVVADRVQT